MEGGTCYMFIWVVAVNLLPQALKKAKHLWNVSRLKAHTGPNSLVFQVLVEKKGWTLNFRLPIFIWPKQNSNSWNEILSSSKIRLHFVVFPNCHCSICFSPESNSPQSFSVNSSSTTWWGLIERKRGRLCATYRPWRWRFQYLCFDTVE